MNRKQRIAVIFLVLAVALLLLSLVVRASIEGLSDSEEVPTEKVEADAKVSLEVLPPQDIEDKGRESVNGKG